MFDIDRGAQDNDPRVGSGRNDSSGGGTVSGSVGSKSSSVTKLGSTFIPTAVIFGVCLVLFIALRPRFKRVYAPRTINALRYPEQAATALPDGYFNWILPFFRTPDSHILNYGSIDGFFFLRYLKVIRNICLGGCIIMWPVLLPINITGGGGTKGLSILTMGNVFNPLKLYAHVFMSWLFFGFVLYTIVRECIYFVNLRQAYLSSPNYSQRLSSRTILVTGIPQRYLDERRLRKLYGDSAKRIVIPRSNKALAKLVEEREQTARRLEDAEVQLIRKANLARSKYLRAHPQHPHDKPPATPPASPTPDLKTDSNDLELGQSLPPSPSSVSDLMSRGGTLHVDLPGPSILSEDSIQNLQYPERRKEGAKRDEKDEGIITEEDVDYMHPYGLDASLPDVRGSVAAQWIPAEARPHHRPIGNFLRRVDTIRWTRMRLKDLNMEIFKLRRRVRRGECGALPAAFIEFDSQENAQAAHQVLTHHRPLQMSQRLLGIRPDEVVWSTLRMSWWERIMRKTAVFAFVLAAIIFWSIPSAFIGFVSNIDSLTKILPFLKFITMLPKPITGFIQGFLPALLLTLLMAIVPVMLRFCGRQAGIPSTMMIELFTQKTYFAFQVVQVFLITTLTSAASSAFQKVLQDPLSARDLLAQNLPNASNFYLSYILIQCVASGSFNMLQVFDFFRHVILVKFINNPRSRFKSWRQLRFAKWGGLFPIYSNMGVIALSYSAIAPLVLIFAALGLWFIGAVWKYNLLYVCDSTHDTKGLFYPTALLHLIVGLYMAEVCLIGLFALKGAYAPVVLMVLFLLFTVIVHSSISEAIAPLLSNLPQTLSLEKSLQEEDRIKAEAAAASAASNGNEDAGAAADYYDPEQGFGEEQDLELDNDEGHITDDQVTVTNDRAIEGASSVRSALTEWLKLSTKEKIQTETERPYIKERLDSFATWLGMKPGSGPPSFVAKWLHPEEYEDFVALSQGIPEDSLARREFKDMFKQCDYTPPEMWLPKPTLWIPCDDARVSKQEVAHTRKVATPISDRGAMLDEKGRVIVDFEASPCDVPRLLV